MSYCLLMSPDSQNVKDPKYIDPLSPAPKAPFKYPDSWYTIAPVSPYNAPLPLLKPLTADDINK